MAKDNRAVHAFALGIDGYVKGCEGACGGPRKRPECS